MLRRAASQDVLDLELADGLESLDDDALLELGVLVVGRQSRERCDDVLTLDVLARREEVTRRLGQEADG